MSIGRGPKSSPPGSATRASPQRVSSGPRTTIDARICSTSSYGASGTMSGPTLMRRSCSAFAAGGVRTSPSTATVLVVELVAPDVLVGLTAGGMLVVVEVVVVLTAGATELVVVVVGPGGGGGGGPGGGGMLVVVDVVVVVVVATGGRMVVLVDVVVVVGPGGGGGP